MPQFIAWGERHGSVFGLRSDDDAASLLEWVTIFRRGGYTPAELHAATDWLAMHDPPRFLNQHLAAIREHVHRQRQAACSRSADGSPEFGECRLCGSTGVICGLPSLRALECGQWATCAALCHCALGRWIGQRQRGQTSSGDPRGPLVTLANYEIHCPNWRTLIAEHDAEIRRELEAESSNCGFAEMDEIVNRIRDRMREA